ncbi:MAG: hypothetical protein ACREF9_03725, partial [Opitutaceae bacterium]
PQTRRLSLQLSRFRGSNVRGSKILAACDARDIAHQWFIEIGHHASVTHAPAVVVEHRDRHVAILSRADRENGDAARFRQLAAASGWSSPRLLTPSVINTTKAPLRSACAVGSSSSIKFSACRSSTAFAAALGR